MTAVDDTDPFGSVTYGFETRAIRAGQPHDPTTGSVVPAIHLATTYAQQAVGDHLGFEYSRTGNPTRQALERNLASLEGARYGFGFASGMAAEDAVLRWLRPGDHVVLGSDAYGGTYRLISKVFEPLGIGWSAIDLADLGAVDSALADGATMVWLETPTNPMLRLVDIRAVADRARPSGALVVVDNTFATPYLQRPLEHGADLVVHSTTKYVGGHSDVVGGFVAVERDDLAEHLGFIQNSVGAVPSPFDCYLALRGVKTLGIRMDRQIANAAAIASTLVSHRAVDDVLYPGLASHVDHAVAARQMTGFGAMVSFTLRDGRDAAVAVTEATRVFTLAESLGAVESLIEYPAVMTHASAVGSPLEVPESLVRLSVGIETEGDLVADLVQALDSVSG